VIEFNKQRRSLGQLFVNDSYHKRNVRLTIFNEADDEFKK